MKDAMKCAMKALKTHRQALESDTPSGCVPIITRTDELATIQPFG
jgi:hypothetical protein